MKPFQSKEALLQQALNLAYGWMEAEKREECEYSLFEFVKKAWPYLDSSEFLECWAARALCEHLEAVTYGEIKRLLVNLPPRCGKTLITSIAWPAWTWIQQEKSFLSGPHVRFLCASYSASLSLSNANTMRRLTTSPWFQKNWGDRIFLTEDQNNKARFDNSEGGSRISTSVGGSLLGLGGDIVCFPGDEIVQTEIGPVSIGEIVTRRLRLRVWSFDPKTGKRGLKPIIGWHRNPGSVIVRVGLSNDTSFRCTPDHQIWTRRGWVEAGRLASLDMLPCFLLNDIADCDAVNAIPTRQCPLTQSGLTNSPHVLFGKLGLWMSNTARAVGTLASTFRNICPRLGAPDLLDRPHRYAEAVSKIASGITAAGDLTNFGFGQLSTRSSFVERKSSVTLGIVNVLGARPIFEIVETWIKAVAVFMARLLAVGTATDKRGHDNLMAKEIVGFSRSPKAHSWVSLVWARLQYGFSLPIRLSRLHDGAGFASDTAKRGNAVSAKPGDRSPQFIRFDGHVDATYCLTVADFNTFVVGSGNIIVSNCIDDPHNTETEKVVETDSDRKKVASWWQEIHSTRLNDPKRSAIAVIMQRLHQGDLSGIILDSDEDWTHLMIPMEFDEMRRSTTIVLPKAKKREPWTDPRIDDGQLMWPERFGPEEVENLKSALGPFMASGRLQQAPVPKGGGILQREWWQPWDGIEAQRYGLEWGPGRKEFPEMSLVVGSLDTAYKEKEENDFNALTIWGLWLDKNGNRRAMLMFAWAKRLPLHGKLISAEPGEAKVNFQERQKKVWGLVEWVADTCKRYKVNRLLIEDKGRGTDLAAEINRLYIRENWGVQLLQVEKDKVSRAHTTVPLFADGAIWAPDTKWAEAVISECANFPKAAHDDLVDSVTQAINWARVNGLLVRGDEASMALEDEMRYKPQLQSIASQYGV